MTIEPDDVVNSARAVSDAGAFVEQTARATTPDHSMLGRVVEAVSVIRLGARLLPAGWRMFKRYPLTSTLGVVGLMLAVYLMRPNRMSTRL